MIKNKFDILAFKYKNMYVRGIECIEQKCLGEGNNTAGKRGVSQSYADVRIFSPYIIECQAVKMRNY